MLHVNSRVEFMRNKLCVCLCCLGRKIPGRMYNQISFACLNRKV